MRDDITIIGNKDIDVIKHRIYGVRGMRVMLDRDLADLYGVETRALNQAVRRNIERFPEDFMFVMTEDEMNIWKSQIVISNFHEQSRRPRTPLNKNTKVSNDNNMEIAVQIEAINNALDQLREKPSEPRKKIGYKQSK